MRHGTPSKTALRVAMRRAAHQMIDSPLVFDDPWAVKILAPLLDGDGFRYEIKRSQHMVSMAFRSFLVGRSRYAEDQLSLAYQNGTRQYVVLGSGLDTFALRNPFDDLQVFEVDFPATQEWKRELLAESDIALPTCLRYVPVDLEHQTLAEGLAAVGFDFTQPAFFSWLGVVMYLTLPSFRTTLETIARCPVGSAVAFDFSLPREALDPTERAALDRLAERVKSAGEPFQLFFTESELATEVDGEFSRAGFSRWEFLDAAQINARYFAHRSDGLRMVGGGARLTTVWK